jgi:hypothetical protein
MCASDATSGLILRANAGSGSTVSLFAEPFEKRRGPSTSSFYSVESGYRLQILGAEKDCYRAELYSGKVGYVSKERTVSEAEYRGKDDVPHANALVQSQELRTLPIFVAEPAFTDGISVYEEPATDSRQLFLLGPMQPVAILEAIEQFYQVLLPGPTEGYVPRNQGAKRVWSPVEEKSQNHFGFYGVAKNRRLECVRYGPDIHAEWMYEINNQFRLPVVQEWDGWFRVQLPDGSLGFVAEAHGNRTITSDVFIEKPKEGGSGLARAGLIAIGVLTAATVGAAIRADE